MRKVKVFLLILILFAAGVFAREAQAATAVFSRADAYAFRAYHNGTFDTTESRLRMGDLNVWCLEPSVAVGENGQSFTVKNEQGAAWLKNKYDWTDSKMNNISKAVYFARQYAADQEWDVSLRYVLIQNVLWSKITTGDDKGWYVLTNGTKEYTQMNTKAKVDKLVDAMYDKVSDYNKKPSWNGKTVTVNVGASLTVSDTESVSNDVTFSGTLPSGLSVTQSAAGLTIKAGAKMAGKTVTLSYVKKQIPTSSFGSGDQVDLYTKSGRQAMGRFNKPMGQVSGTLKVTVPMPKVSLSGTKVWRDSNNAYQTRPKTYTIRLLRNGAAFKSTSFDSASNWSFTNLDQYDANGSAYQYTAAESAVSLSNGDSYQPAKSGTVFTNTLTGTTSVSVQKKWNDWNDEDQLRPETISVTLQSVEQGRGTDLQEVVLSAANNWQAEVSGLPKYKNGQKIIYQFVEKQIPEGYTAKSTTDEAQTQIVNTHQPTKEITLRKKINAQECLDYLEYLQKKGISTCTVFLHLTSHDESGETEVLTHCIRFDREYVKGHTDAEGYVTTETVFTDLEDKIYVASESGMINYKWEKTMDIRNGTDRGRTIQFRMAYTNKAEGTFLNGYDWQGILGETAVNHIRIKK